MLMSVRISMTQQWALLVLVHLLTLQAAALHHRKDFNKSSIPALKAACEDFADHFRTLYPSAYRIKRGTYSLINPTFQSSKEGVNLLFEILLAGMQIRGDGQTLLIPDEELASLRSVTKLEVICEDILPKRLSNIRRLTAELAWRRQPLSWQDFERTVLTLVYTYQTLAQITDQQQRELWADVLMQLFQAVQRDLHTS